MSRIIPKNSGKILVLFAALFPILLECWIFDSEPEPETFRYVVSTIRDMSVEEYGSQKPIPYPDWPLEFVFENNPMEDFTGMIKWTFVGWQDIDTVDGSGEAFFYRPHRRPFNEATPYDTLNIEGWHDYFDPHVDFLQFFWFFQLEIPELSISGRFLAGGVVAAPRDNKFAAIRSK